MGFGDALNAVGNAFMKYTPTGKVLHAAFGSTPHAAAPPGTLTGPPPAPGRLKYTAGPNGTQQAVDPVTGQVYVPDGKGGLTAQQTPNVQQQSGLALNRAAGFYGQVPSYDAREAAAYGGEGQTADYLNSIAHGMGPTVAGTQLAVGEDQAARQQLAQAAGASGNNAALARMVAMGNTGLLDANTNQAQALARAGEMTNAINQLAGVQGNMVGQSQAMGGQKLSAADTLNALAMSGEGGHEQNVLDASKTNAAADNAANARWLNMASGAISGAAGMGGGGIPKAA